MIYGAGISYKQSLLIPYKLAKVETILMNVLSLFMIALTPATLLVTAYFIDAAIVVAQGTQEINSLYLPLFLILMTSLFSFISQPLIELIQKKSAIKMKLSIRLSFLEKYTKLEYKHIENKDTMDLLNRVWSNPDAEISGILSNFTSFILMVFVTISYMAIIIVNASIMGILIIVLALPIIYISNKTGKAVYEATRQTTINQRWQWNIAWVLQSRSCASERNLFGYTDYLDEKFSHHYELARKHNLAVAAKYFIRSKAATVFYTLFSVIGLFVLIPEVYNGNLSFGLYIALQGSLYAIINRITSTLPTHMSAFSRQKEVLKDINEFLSLSETVDAHVLPAETSIEFKSLELKNVSFTYPGTNNLILDNISVVFEKGKTYAFVGANGAGKTTLTKLMIRLYDDYEGEILINGVNIKEIPMERVKSTFCALFQEFAKYDITVAENTAIGKIANASCEDIDKALKLSGFDINAVNLLYGKNTLLGKTHKENIDLSKGQWQRLALSRAIISPAPVKILDEPTAALDPVAESQMYTDFERVVGNNATTIIISHRLGVAKMADIILVIDDGKIIERGSHKGLMLQNGAYAQMFNSQKSWYD